MSTKQLKRGTTILLAIILLVGLFAPQAAVAAVNRLPEWVMTDGPSDGDIYVPADTPPAGVTYYYVDDVNGDDTNNGTSPTTAWKTTQRVNQATFQPGDHLLYKRGGVFVGSLVPKGSGTVAAPIVIASYGEGPRAKLVPTPEGNYVLPNDLRPTNTNNGGNVSAGTTLPLLNSDYVFYPYWYVSNQNNPYFGVDQIRLANVEHYIVRDLELHDPNYETNLPVQRGDSGNRWINSGTNPNQRYRRGILLYNEDAGPLHGFTLDNLLIHGYRGTNSNRGKSSGGIIIQTNTSGTSLAARDGTSTINDITITNCELYDLGRDGINITSPWSGRTTFGITTEGDQWRTTSQQDWNSSAGWVVPGPGGNVGSNGATDGRPGFVPCENVYISNNIMHDIDGDATIVDGCRNTIMENNIVWHCEYSVNMAVGIFTWNSDFSIFQFNESFNNFPAHARGNNGDGQGMEIDALSRDTVFQYNYTHNNAGWMMNCSTNDPLRSFRNIWRYNISQYDDRVSSSPGGSWGVIEWRNNVWGMRVYNNTVIMRNSNKRFFKDDDANNTHRDVKFFNNLFYFDVPVANPGTNQGVLSTRMTKATLGGPNVQWTNNVFYNFPHSGLTQAFLGGVANNNLILTGPTGSDNPLIKTVGGGLMSELYPANSAAPRGVPSASGVFETLRGYEPKMGSPLIGAGRALVNDPWSENALAPPFNSHDPNDGYNGGRDFFDTPVVAGGRIDIGAVQYVVVNYAVTYNGNGGVGTLVDPADNMANYKVPTNASASFARANHTFAGWSQAANGSLGLYDDGDTILGVQGDSILYAQWTRDAIVVGPGPVIVPGW